MRSTACTSAEFFTWLETWGNGALASGVATIQATSSTATAESTAPATEYSQHWGVAWPAFRGVGDPLDQPVLSIGEKEYVAGADSQATPPDGGVVEIQANDVRCTHAAAIAQIDPEQLFYLRSRGLPEPAAKRLVIEGFLASLVERFEEGPVREVLAAALESRLAKVLDDAPYTGR